MPQSPDSLFVVVVLYHCRPAQSPSIKTLKPLLRACREQVKVLVYDNSPVGTEVPLDDGWIYQHDESNGGVAAAYNAALSLAVHSKEWLLLLDEDSHLPEGFLHRLKEAIDEVGDDPAVAAIVPHIYWHSKLISPMRTTLGFCRREPGVGHKSHRITALNSGSALRIRSIVDMGGFDGFYWLDFLDHWLYREIYRSGSHVFVSRGSLDHSLSVLEPRRLLSFARYQSILRAEFHFVNSSSNRAERALHVVRLALRSLKMALLNPDKRFAQEAAKLLFLETKALLRRA